MYQALYRKYRPQRFSDVIGQDHITSTLRRQVETGRTSHAYLFVGSRGTGKTTCAKILARALNCEHPVGGEPCNECAACRGILSGSILDVAEIDAASNNGVDNVRAIREEAIFSPASVKKRVYIIDEVHMLSLSAFNALLKILEEPPEHLVFILATTELNKVPATILSRCQRFSFKRILPADIEKRIRFIADAEKLTITDGAVSLLARLGDGAMRDALSLLDQCLTGGTVDENTVLSAVGLAASTETANIWKALAAGDCAAAVGRFSELYLGGSDPASVLNSLLSLVRDMMMVRVAPGASAGLISGTYGREALESLASGLDIRQLVAASETIQETVSRIGALRDRRTAAEVCLIKLAMVLTGQYAAPAQAAAQPGRSARPPVRQAPPTPPAQPPVQRTASQPVEAPVRDEAPPPWEDLPPAGSLPPLEEAPPPWEDEPPEAFVPWNSAPAQAAQPAPSQAAKPAEPTRQPAPAIRQPSASEAPSDAGFWDEVLRRLKPTLDGAKYRLLSDKMNASGRVEGSAVVIAVSNAFYQMMLDTGDLKSAVASVAASVLGRNVTARVQVEDRSAELQEDKLDSLSRFGNITFTNG